MVKSNTISAISEIIFDIMSFSAYYILGSQCWAVIFLLCSIITIVIHHNNSNKPPPGWVRKYINKSAKYLCIDLEQHGTESKDGKWKLPQQNVPIGINLKDSEVTLTTDAKEENKQSTKYLPLFQLILNIENTKREKEWIQPEWQWVANVLNRLFFAVAFSLNLVSLFIFLLAINDKI